MSTYYCMTLSLEKEEKVDISSIVKNINGHQQ